jgi:cyclopropane-fatty-acyl-phospholipid synthase
MVSPPGRKFPCMILQKLILNLFGRLGRGRLTVVLPDGEERVFGGLGSDLQAELRVHSPNFWRRCVLYGPIGFAEAFMEGEWTTPDLVKLLAFFILNHEENPALKKPDRGSTIKVNLLNGWNQLIHRRRHSSLPMARKNIREHYDLSNDFFRLWLDPGMTYSSAFFSSPGMGLEEAQQAKYDRLCRKLQLREGEHLLEIGTGWGGMSIHAAQNYGCRVTTVTISEEQFHEAQTRIAQAGLGHRIEVKLLDYRRIEGRFDKIVSIEMLEAVGDRYLEDFFAKCAAVLNPYGLLGLQMITCPDRQFTVLRDGVDFIQKHIFPGSLLLSERRVNEAVFRTSDLNLHDWRDLGPHYAQTLKLWREAFLLVLPQVRSLGFDEIFLRKWEYYLAYCEAAFGTRHISVVQAVYTRPNNHNLADGPYPLWR